MRAKRSTFAESALVNGFLMLPWFSLVGSLLAGSPERVKRLDLVIAAPDSPAQKIEALAPGHVRMVNMDGRPVTLSFRNDQFRGSRLLVLQMGHVDDDARTLQLDQAMPSRQWLDSEWRVDAYPHGWLARYCGAFEAISDPFRRRPSARLLVDGRSYLTPSDWRGETGATLEPVHPKGGFSPWRVAPAGDDAALVFENANTGQRFSLESPRGDMPALRDWHHADGIVTVAFTPEAYSFELCRSTLPDHSGTEDRLEQRLTEYFFDSRHFSEQ